MPTTNQTSRAPNRKRRAKDKRFTRLSCDRQPPQASSDFSFPGRPAGRNSTTAIRITAKTPAIAQTAASNPASARRTAPRKNPSPFTAFFDPVSADTQRKRPPSSFGAKSFTADFEDILARSFATPETP